MTDEQKTGIDSEKQAFDQKEMGRARTPRKTPTIPKTASILISWFRAWVSLNLRPAKSLGIVCFFTRSRRLFFERVKGGAEEDRAELNGGLK